MDPYNPNVLKVYEFASKEEAKVDYVAPQPPPKNDPDAKPLWPMVIAECEQRATAHFKVGTQSEENKANALRAITEDMQKRHEFGIAKYGVPFVAKNDRDHLSDAYQELLDAIVYLRAQIETLGGLPDPPLKIYAKDLQFRALIRIYAQTIENAIEIRTLLAERDGR
jgi:hypothetical protein